MLVHYLSILLKGELAVRERIIGVFCHKKSFFFILKIANPEGKRANMQKTTRGGVGGVLKKKISPCSEKKNNRTIGKND